MASDEYDLVQKRLDATVASIVDEISALGGSFDEITGRILSREITTLQLAADLGQAMIEEKGGRIMALETALSASLELATKLSFRARFNSPGEMQTVEDEIARLGAVLDGKVVGGAL